VKSECFHRRIEAGHHRTRTDRRTRAGAKSRIRGFDLFAFALGILLLHSVGCSGPDPTAPPSAPPITGYIVGAPDLLSINILPEPEINREVRVRPDGMISIDLIGDIQAAGRTPFEIAQSIQDSIGRFKRDASVNVSVVDSPSQFLTIFGEVARPGTFPLATETRVTEALGQVGGTLPFASLNNIRVIRTNGSKTEVIPVRLADIQKGDLSTNFVVEEGDLIIVPPTWLARVGYVIQMIFFPFQPVLTTAGSVGGTAAGVRAF
jgi:polysaccharide export outer membrane protein